MALLVLQLAVVVLAVSVLPWHCVAANGQVVRVALSRSALQDHDALLLATAAHARHEKSSLLSIDNDTATAPAAHADAAETRLYSGEGSHTIRVRVGGQLRELIVDTGSGKTAFVCDGCAKCGTAHTNAPFTFTAHTTFLPCDDADVVPQSPPLFSPLSVLFSFAKPEPQNKQKACATCLNDKCAYSQTYVEGDFWNALKVRDVLQLAPTTDPSFAAVVDFGCIYEQNGVFTLQTSDGIMGFSRHPDAIHEQFYRQHVTTNRLFAQCLGKRGGVLTLGGVDVSLANTKQQRIQWTPLRDTGYQYWTVTLVRVTIGTVALAVDPSVWNDHRGCVLDSGTTFIYLPVATERAFRTAWRAAVGTNAWMPISGAVYGLAPVEVAQLPTICFHFVHDATLCVAPAMYLIQTARRHFFAGTLFFSDAAKSTIVGATALTNHNVVYDSDNQQVGLVSANCDDALIESDKKAPAALVALSRSPRSGGDGGDRLDPIAAMDVLNGGASSGHKRRVEMLTAVVQLLLVALTLVGVVGLVNVVWTELVVVRETEDERRSSSIECCGVANETQTTDVRQAGLPATATLTTPLLLLEGGGGGGCDDREDELPSAFAFMRMRDDDDGDV